VEVIPANRQEESPARPVGHEARQLSTAGSPPIARRQTVESLGITARPKGEVEEAPPMYRYLVFEHLRRQPPREANALTAEEPARPQLVEHGSGTVPPRHAIAVEEQDGRSSCR